MGHALETVRREEQLLERFDMIKARAGDGLGSFDVSDG
jgi:hypothetical protein